MPTKGSWGQNSQLGPLKLLNGQNLSVVSGFCFQAVCLFLYAGSSEWSLPWELMAKQHSSRPMPCHIFWAESTHGPELAGASEQLMGDLIGVCKMQPTSWCYLDMQQLITNSHCCYPCLCHYSFSDWFPMKLIKYFHVEDIVAVK